MNDLQAIFPNVEKDLLLRALKLANGETEIAATLIIEHDSRLFASEVLQNSGGLSHSVLKSTKRSNSGWHKVVQNGGIAAPLNSFIGSSEIKPTTKGKHSGQTDASGWNKTTTLGEKPLYTSMFHDSEAMDSNDLLNKLVNELVTNFPEVDRHLIQDILLGLGPEMDITLATECLRGLGVVDQVEDSGSGQSNLSEDKLASDVQYLQSRKEALKYSRSRDRHSRAAMKAFLEGDHQKAKANSRKAQEDRIKSDLLHKAAAETILQQQANGNIWTLDLHFLYAQEAVHALAIRLKDLTLQIEKGFFREPEGGHQEREGSAASQFTAKKAAKQLPELMVITGIGKHSRDGPILPQVVESFLLENGYQFHKPREGVFAVKIIQTAK